MSKKKNLKRLDQDIDDMLDDLDQGEKKEPIRSKWRDLDIKKLGRPKNIKDPEELLEHFQSYVTEVDENPFIRLEVLKGGAAAGKTVEVPTIRPYTWTGFSTYLFTNGILAKLDDYKSNKENRYTAFAGILAYIGEAMYSQKFEGATVGAFNANIIARDLGLAEKTVNDTNLTEETLIDYSQLSDAALEEIAKQVSTHEQANKSKS